MTLRPSFHLLRPQFGKFLFATVDNEMNGMPLTVISALARLGLDPWEEAQRLSLLGNREAAEQLARLIAEVPGSIRPLREARVLAAGLVCFLGKHNPGRTAAPKIQLCLPYRTPLMPKRVQFWFVCFVPAAAALVGAAAHGGFPFGIWSP